MELIFLLYIKSPGRHRLDIMMEWSVKDSAMASSQEKHPAELGIRKLSSRMQYMHCTNSWYMVLCPQQLEYMILRTNRVEVGLSPLIIIPKDPAVKFICPIPLTLGCLGLEIFPPATLSPMGGRGRIFSQEDSLSVPLNLKLSSASSYFGFLSQLAKRQRQESPY